MNMIDLKLTMGERIRITRESRHLSREELAALLHLSTKSIANIECGTKGMSLRTFVLLTQTLHVSADYLLFGIPQPFTPALYCGPKDRLK